MLYAQKFYRSTLEFEISLFAFDSTISNFLLLFGSGCLFMQVYGEDLNGFYIFIPLCYNMQKTRNILHVVYVLTVCFGTGKIFFSVLKQG